MPADSHAVFLGTETDRSAAVRLLSVVPLGYVVRLKKPARSEDQSRKLHAICSALAHSSLEWDGSWRTKNEWKWLLVSGYLVASGEPVIFANGLEGERVAMRPSTTELTSAEMGELIEYAQAFCAEHGVKLKEDRAA